VTSFGSFCSIFYPLSNSVLVKSIRVQIKKLQSFKNWKNASFAKTAILTIFYFVPGGFQYTAKGILIPKDLKLDEISIKKQFKIFHFSKKFKECYFCKKCNFANFFKPKPIPRAILAFRILCSL